MDSERPETEMGAVQKQLVIGGCVKLSRQQRAELKNKFGGACAYCGTPLGDSWHADHLEPVRREAKYIVSQSSAGQRGKFVSTGELERPEHDHIGNMMPSCAPCNIDKSAMSLDVWRKKLERSAEVLARTSSTYRHAVRFGLVSAMEPRVTFYFERISLLDEAK